MSVAVSWLLGIGGVFATVLWLSPPNRRAATCAPARSAPIPMTLVALPMAAIVGALLGSWFMALLGVVAAVAGPRAQTALNQKRSDRLVARAWPEVLEVLTMGVGAGMTLEQLLDFVVRTGPGPTRPLFGRARAMLWAGATRRETLGALAADAGPTLDPVVTVLLAAERDGASVALVLDRLTAEASRAHRLAAEERARRAPVLMLAPLTLCSLPAVLIGTVAPFILLTFGQTSF